MSRAPANRTTGLFSLDPMDPCLPLDVLAASQFTDRGPWQKDSTTGPHEPMCAPDWLKDAHFLALVGPWRASAVGSRAELPATPLNRDGSGMWRSGNGTYRARLESHGRTKSRTPKAAAGPPRAGFTDGTSQLAALEWNWVWPPPIPRETCSSPSMAEEDLHAVAPPCLVEDRYPPRGLHRALGLQPRQISTAVCSLTRGCGSWPGHLVVWCMNRRDTW